MQTYQYPQALLDGQCFEFMLAYVQKIIIA